MPISAAMIAVVVWLSPERGKQTHPRQQHNRRGHWLYYRGSRIDCICNGFHAEFDREHANDHPNQVEYLVHTHGVCGCDVHVSGRQTAQQEKSQPDINERSAESRNGVRAGFQHIIKISF